MSTLTALALFCFAFVVGLAAQRLIKEIFWSVLLSVLLSIVGVGWVLMYFQGLRYGRLFSALELSLLLALAGAALGAYLARRQ